MASGKPVGTIFVELDLDATKFTSAQKRIISDAGKVVFEVEKNYSTLGIKSGAMFDAMRLQAENAYMGILKSSRSTADDIVRAEQAKNAKIADLNRQQYGENKSFVESLKQNWLGVSAAVTAAYLAIGKAMDIMEGAHKVKEQIEVLDSLGKQWGVTGQQIVDRSKAAANGLLSVSDAAAISAKGILAGMAPQQMENMIPLAERLSKVWGTDVAGAFENLSNALMTGRERALKKLGVTLDLTKAYKDFADQNKISVDQLDAETKLFVGLNVVAAKQSEIMAKLPPYQEDVMKSYDRMKIAAAGTVREIGYGMITALTSVHSLYIEHKTVIVGAAVAIGSLAVAQLLLSTAMTATFIPSIVSATLAVKAFTLSLLANPVILAIAVALGVGAAAYSHYKSKAEEATKANDDFLKSLRSGGSSSAGTMVSVLEDDLKRAKAAFSDAAKESDRLSQTKWGGNLNPQISAARAETVRLGEEVKRLEGLLRTATGAQKELGTAEAAADEQRKKIADDIKKSQAQAEAERKAKEREKVERETIPEMIRKNQFDLSGESETEYNKEMARIENQKKAWLDLGVSRAKVNDWVSSSTSLAGKKESDRIAKLEGDLMNKQIAERERWGEATAKSAEEASAALNKFVTGGLEPEDKALAEVDRQMAEVNAKLREQYGITAETIDIDSQYLSKLSEVYAEGEKRKAQIIETAAQQRIAQDQNLKFIDEELKASLQAETGAGGYEKPKEYTAADAYNAAYKWGNADLGMEQQIAMWDATGQAVNDAQAKMDLFRTAMIDANQSVWDSIREGYNAMTSGLSNAMAGIITGTMTAQEALKSLGQSMIRIVTDYVAKWIISRLLLAVMGPKMAMAATLAMLPAAAAAAKMWAPAATLASVGSFGGAAAAGSAGLISAFATAEGIAAMSAVGGAAHGGLDSVPKEQTYLLDKGERVVSPKQNADLTDFLKKKDAGDAGSQTINVYLDGESLFNAIHRGVRNGQLNLRMA
jgi:DNA-binding transcriptional regulator YdaS (Cro superfamily)